MLTMTCNRCEKSMGTVPPDGRHPGSKFQAIVFDEKEERLVEMCELDLCDTCARELAEAVAKWFPMVGEAQAKWNKVTAAPVE